MRFGAALAALALLIAQPAFARDYGDSSSSPEYYRSRDGSDVHRPTRKADPTLWQPTCRTRTA
jgi:hypothetical protein